MANAAWERTRWSIRHDTADHREAKATNDGAISRLSFTRSRSVLVLHLEANNKVFERTATRRIAGEYVYSPLGLAASLDSRTVHAAVAVNTWRNQDSNMSLRQTRATSRPGGSFLLGPVGRRENEDPPSQVRARGRSEAARYLARRPKWLNPP
jgi:hypothetical protein